MFTSFCQKSFWSSNPTFEIWQIEVSRRHEQLHRGFWRLSNSKRCYQQLGSSFLIFSPFCTVNSKNPLLLFGTCVAEQYRTAKSKSHSWMHREKVIWVLVFSTTSIAFFGSRLVPLINYAIGTSTLNFHPFNLNTQRTDTKLLYWVPPQKIPAYTTPQHSSSLLNLPRCLSAYVFQQLVECEQGALNHSKL